MEQVHKPEIRDWISKVVNVKTFRDEWICTKYNLSILGIPENEILKSSSIPPHLIKKLEKECGEHAFVCEYEDDVEVTDIFTIPENVNLETLRKQETDMHKRNSDPIYKSHMYNNCKYTNYPPNKIVQQQQSDDTNKVHFPDVLLTVQMYRPVKAVQRFQSHIGFRAPTFNVDQDFSVLGCQFLTELRDKISCVSDYYVPGEFSNNPNGAMYSDESEVAMKSGFFYIEGVFYNDMRDRLNKDYSVQIMEWSRTTAEGVGPFKSTKMEDTQFINLNIRLGYPYVYVHQGNCEHLLVFSDLRMLTLDDNTNRNEYPLMNSLITKKPIFCMVCQTHVSRWVVTKSDRLPSEPYFFCQRCFESYNYTHEGEKIGQFEARKHIDRTIML